jgi:UDP-N-acetyl-D-mannosaminuronate dehydrogenase
MRGGIIGLGYVGLSLADFRVTRDITADNHVRL